MAMLAQGSVCAKSGNDAPIARKIFTDGGHEGVDRSHRRNTMSEYTNRESGKKAGVVTASAPPTSPDCALSIGRRHTPGLLAAGDQFHPTLIKTRQPQPFSGL
jgi:hypothetical protein